MPHQRMTDDVHVIFFSELYKFVGQIKVKFTFFGLNFAAFHAVFGRDRIKVIFDNGNTTRISFGNLSLIHSHSNQKFVFQRILQSNFVISTSRQSNE